MVGRSGQRSRRADRHARGADTAKDSLMGENDLEAVWGDGRCDHMGGTMSLYGLRATLSCSDCDTSMSLTLKFGRPKTFDVTMDDCTIRPVGRASAHGVRNFMRGAIAHISVPSAQYPGNISERDSATLSMLMEELTDGIRVKRPPKTDFAGPWRAINCSHKSVSCQLYGNQILLECSDCATKLVFAHTGKDAFHVSMARLPLPANEYVGTA